MLSYSENRVPKNNKKKKLTTMAIEKVMDKKGIQAMMVAIDTRGERKKVEVRARYLSTITSRFTSGMRAKRHRIGVTELLLARRTVILLTRRIGDVVLR